MRKVTLLFALFVLVVAVQSSFQAQAHANGKRNNPPQQSLVKTLVLQPITKSATLYQRFEMQITTDLSVDNPFDPDQADLAVQFVAPSGKITRIPAFWYQDFNDSLLTVGKPGWRVRFTPSEVGAWRALAESSKAESSKTKSKPLTFTVTTSASPGFVRVNSANSHYFAFDNGDLYVPIGLNIAWSSGAGKAVLLDYARWFDRLRTSSLDLRVSPIGQRIRANASTLTEAS